MSAEDRTLSGQRATSMLQAAWAREQCPDAAGVFFPDGTAFPIRSDSARGVARASGTALLGDPDDQRWADLTTLCAAADAHVRVEAGECAYEGDGFLAATDVESGALLWIIVMSQSEAFSDVELAGGQVVAVAEVYPHLNTLVVPLAAPEAFTFTRQSEL